VTSGGIEWLEPPVVEDEQLHAAERPLDAGIATVAAGEREIGEQLGNALVEDGAIVATCFVAERGGEPTLADAGRPHDILRKNNPLRLSSDIRIIHSPERESLPFAASSMPVWFTLSSKDPMDVALYCRRG
jgi:hypothetical protein